MANEGGIVVIELNKACGDGLRALMRQGPVWILDSEVNRAAADSVLRARRVADGAAAADAGGAVTVFTLVTPWELAELADVIPTVVEHHAQAKTVEIDVRVPRERERLDRTNVNAKIGAS